MGQLYRDGVAVLDSTKPCLIRRSAIAVYSARPLPLMYASPTQANFQIPAGTAPGDATITVTAGGISFRGFGEVKDTAPAISVNMFHFDAPWALPCASSPIAHKPRCRSPPGSHWTIGPFTSASSAPIRNHTSLADVACTISGVSVPVEYAGPAPGFVGMDQVNLRPTKGLPSSDYDPLILSVDGRLANTFYITIK